jgi:hypothetical protein
MEKNKPRPTWQAADLALSSPTAGLLEFFELGREWTRINANGQNKSIVAEALARRSKLSASNGVRKNSSRRPPLFGVHSRLFAFIRGSI